MHQYDKPEFESFISFTCPTCKSSNQDVIGVPMGNWGGKTYEDRIGKAEQTFICARCLTTFKLSVSNLSNRVVVKIIDHPNVKVTASEAYYTEEAEVMGIAPWETPETDPYNIFDDTMKDVLAVIQSPHADFFGKTLSRMAFIQQFAALEAYLSDTLLSRVITDPEVLKRLIAGTPELSTLKLSLADVVTYPDIGKKTVVNAVNKISFHNLTKTDAIWNKAFGHSIFREDETRNKMHSFVAIRHDCVHRNGKSEDGKERTEVDFDFVRDVDELFTRTVLHIEGKFEGTDFIADENETT